MDERQHQHLSELRQAYLQRLRVNELRIAREGAAVPAHVSIEISELREKMAEIDDKLSHYSTQVTSQVVHPATNKVVEVIIKGNFEILTPETSSAIVLVLAAMMKVPDNQIEILRVTSGSIVFTLSVPAEGVELLLKLFQDGNPVIDEVGIEHVTVLHNNDPNNRSIALGVGKKDINMVVWGENRELESTWEVLPKTKRDETAIIKALSFYEKAIIARRDRDFSSAVEYLKEALKIGYEDARVWDALGDSLAMLPGRLNESLFAFERAIKIDSSLVSAFRHRARVLRDIGRYQESLLDFDRAIQLDPFSSWAFAGKGETLRIIKDYDEALRLFSKALQIKPDFAWAYAGRGEVSLELGLYENAIRDYNMALQFNPNDFYSYSGRGETFRRAGDFTRAIEDFTSAIRINPLYAWAYAQRSETYRLIGLQNKADEDRARASELDTRYT